MPPTFASHPDRVQALMDAFLARLGPRERASVEKHLAVCDAEPDRNHASLWRRLAGLLASLTPSTPRRCGTQAFQFFTPDGPYRKQVFALEDRHNGVIVLYLPDVLSAAVERGLVTRDGENFRFPASPENPIPLTILTAANSKSTPEHVEHMLGWNRKAVRIVLRTSQSNSPESHAAESLCRFAAVGWVRPSP